MNKKFINKKTYEIVDNTSDADEYIAERIPVLNKKGYYTKYCYSRYVKDPRLYEFYKNINELDEKSKKRRYIINKQQNCYDILIYMMFDEDYNFNILSKGFNNVENNTISTKNRILCRKKVR